MGDHRQNQCADYQELGACEIIKIKHFQATGEIRLMLPTMRPRSDYKALSSVTSWKQYFHHISDNAFGQYFTEDFKPAKSGEEHLHACRAAKMATEASSFVLTIIAALVTTMPDLATRIHLNIHIVGASDMEMQIQRMNEEFLHLLPKLKDLVVGCIGPDLPVEGEGPDYLMPVGCCPNCANVGRTRHLFAKRLLYHDFMYKCPLFAQHPPDIIVAFDSGHTDAETSLWMPTLQHILDLDVPALFTTFNEQEAYEEELLLERMGAKFVKRRAQNLWRGMMPYFDTLMGRYEKYYTNNYWYIVKGRQRHIM